VCYDGKMCEKRKHSYDCDCERVCSHCKKILNDEDKEEPFCCDYYDRVLCKAYEGSSLCDYLIRNCFYCDEWYCYYWGQSTDHPCLKRGFHMCDN
jgi:hypothetical protein